jgi:ferritin-like metal-binding protein YciE
MNSSTIDLADKSALRDIFINQLSLLYAAKIHLTENLPEIIEQANFTTLKLALNEDLEDSIIQMKSLSQIFLDLKESAVSEYCLGMNAVIREAHAHINFHDGQNYESDMSIIFYMGVMEHLQIGAGRMLNLIVKNEPYKAYAQLVGETLDMDKDNARLFQLIAAEYISKH